MPAESNQVIQNLIEQKKLFLIAGSLCSINEKDGKLEVLFKYRKNGEPGSLRIDYVMNCLGPAGQLQDIDDPLLHQLFDAGFIRPNSDQLIPEVSPEFQIINRDGLVEKGIFAIGSLKKDFYSTTSNVPRISLEVEKLSRKLAVLNRDWLHTFFDGP